MWDNVETTLGFVVYKGVRRLEEDLVRCNRRRGRAVVGSSDGGVVVVACLQCLHLADGPACRGIV